MLQQFKANRVSGPKGRGRGRGQRMTPEQEKMHRLLLEMDHPRKAKEGIDYREPSQRIQDRPLGPLEEYVWVTKTQKTPRVLWEKVHPFTGRKRKFETVDYLPLNRPKLWAKTSTYRQKEKGRLERDSIQGYLSSCWSPAGDR